MNNARQRKRAALLAKVRKLSRLREAAQRRYETLRNQAAEAWGRYWEATTRP